MKTTSIKSCLIIASYLIAALPAWAGNYSVLYRFKGGKDGFHPEGGLTSLNGTLYGTTADGGDFGHGTVFSITPDGHYTRLYSFKAGQDGAAPNIGLVNVNGTLYGATGAGGSHGLGTIFSITIDGREKVVYSFKGHSDGDYPDSNLINVNGVLYGATAQGGRTGKDYSDNCEKEGCGTIFSLTLDGKEKILRRFEDLMTDNMSYIYLTNINNTIYAADDADPDVESGCNKSGCGSIFSLKPDGSFNSFYHFTNWTQGYSPASLVADSNMLYGAAQYGGEGTCDNAGCGKIFSVDLKGNLKILYSFQSGRDGGVPTLSLITSNHILYGTTEYGGGSGCALPSPDLLECGTVFSVTIAGKKQTLYAFSGKDDGTAPSGNLVNIGNAIYGTTRHGGIDVKECKYENDVLAQGCGVIYKVTP